MKCEINFEANQVDESSFYRRGDSDGQIPALVPCQGKVDRIKLRRLLDGELVVGGNLRGAVDSQVTTQISRSFLLYQLYRRNFRKRPAGATFLRHVWELGTLLRLASEPDRTNYVGGGNE